jgi:RNA polymerase sigma factor (sigma-70 family)
MNFKILSDNELVSLLSKKEDLAKSAFNEIYLRYSKKIYVYCKKSINDNKFIEDIYQETFVKFYNSGRSGVKIENLQTYLFRIVRNLCLNYKRDNNQVFIEIEEFHLISENDYYQEKELNSLINQALEMLIDEHREAFIMQTYQELSYNEIADMLEVPVTTVRNRIVRAKRKLKEILTPYFERKKLEEDK